MRSFVVTILIALLGIAGFGAYRYFAPPPPAKTVEAPKQKPAPSTAEYCASADALYTLRGDRKYTMRMESGGSYIAPAFLLRDFAQNGAGERTFVVTTPDKRVFRFALVASLGYTSNYLFPIRGEKTIVPLTGVDLIPVSLFDTQHQYVPGLPNMNSAAPARVWAPNIARYLYKSGGEPRLTPEMNFFDFEMCEEALSAAPSTAP
jgi:hypothetical protein